MGVKKARSIDPSLEEPYSDSNCRRFPLSRATIIDSTFESKKSIRTKKEKPTTITSTNVQAPGRSRRRMGSIMRKCRKQTRLRIWEPGRFSELTPVVVMHVSVRNWVIIRWWTIHEGGRESSRSGSPGQHNRVNTVGVAAAVRSANNSREVAGSLGLTKGMVRAEPKEGDATDDRECDGEEPRDDK
jgi:hypothetical protein